MVRTGKAMIAIGAIAIAGVACSGLRPGWFPLGRARGGTVPKVLSPRSVPSAAPVQVLVEKIASIEGITEYRLANGLRVLCFPDATKQTLTVNVTYFVGSRMEGYGESGMAHLLEHMLFKGTPTRADPKTLLEQRGGGFNGTTSYDRTNYFEQLPASEENLEFAIALEADRMVNSKIAPEDLAKEFSVVRNEFEIGENQPGAVLLERMRSTAFLWHNYGKSPIGSRADIERVPAENLRAFYQRYYQPDNAMIVLAGSFDESRALSLVGRYFGSIPRPSRKLAPTYTIEPVQDGERTVVLRRSGDVGAVGLIYHAVPGAHEDYLPLDAAVQLLTAEPSGRLYKALVASGMATSVGGDLEARAEPGTALFYAEVDSKKPIEPVREKMTQIVENFAVPSADEVKRYVNQQKKAYDLAMTQSDTIAILLSEFAAMGDWRLFFVLRDQLDSLKPEAVQSAAKRYLLPANRTLGTFVPTPAAKIVRSPLPSQPDVTALVQGYQGRAQLSAGQTFDPAPSNIERRTQRFTLTNGMKVALLPKETRGDSVQVAMLIHYGSEADLRSKVTATGLIAPMLMRGTRKLDYQQIRDRLDALRAEASISPQREPGSALLAVTTVRDSLVPALDLVADMLMQPSFPASELEVVRREVIAEREAQLQDPTAQAFNVVSRAVAPFAPTDVRYRPTIEESIERLRAVQLSDVKGLYDRLWGGSHAELAIVGDFDPAAVKKLLDARYATWKSPRAFERIGVQYKDVNAVSKTIDTPDKEAALVVAAHPIRVRDDSPDYPALALASYILGGGSSSRLNQRLRERDGISYGAFANIVANPLDDFGYILLGAQTAPQNAARARAAVQEELERFVAQGVTPEELADAKKGYAETRRLTFTDDATLALLLSDQLYLDRTLAFEESLRSKIQALTPEDLVAAVRRHIVPARLSQVLAGDLRKVNAQ